MHKYKILISIFMLTASPALADEALIYARHFEVPTPKKDAPKLVAVVLPEERMFREITAENRLLPIGADPVAEIQPDVVE